jgi:imidazolonepropionase-like amidohydrolase
LAPASALLAATRDAALAIGTPASDLGTIERGKFADLVLLTASPLEDIRNVRRVEWVMLGGVVYRPEGLRDLP